jgi:cell division protein FtsL
MVANLVAGVSVVYTAWTHRALLMAYQAETERQERIRAELSQVHLEQSALAASPRIEKLAREKIGMHYPLIKEVVELNVAAEKKE